MEKTIQVLLALTVEEFSREKLIVSTCIDSSDVKTLKLDLGILGSEPKKLILEVNIIL